MSVTGDDLIGRLAPDEGEAALVQPGVRAMDFTSRPMGFVYVGPEGLETERLLIGRVGRGVAFASILPAKKPERSVPRTPA